MAQTMIGIGDEIATNLCFDEPSNACWFATSSGDIRTFRVLGQRVTTLGGGWGDALAVLPSIDGLSVRVVLRTGEVLVAARDNCQRAAATLVAAIGSAAIAAECLDGDALLILDASGTVHRVVPRDGSTSVLVDAGPDATLLAVDRTGGELVVAVHAATWELHRRKLQDGTAVAAPMPLTGALTAMATLPGGGGVLMADDVGQVSKQRWSGATDPFSFSVPGATALCIWHSLVMTAAGSQLMLCEWGRDVTLLTLICGFDPIAVGGWAAMTVDYGALGLGIDEVEWRVREGHAAASVSVARPSAQSADRYEHRVISGIGAPEFRIEAVEKATGKRLATRRFRVVQCWPDARLGPPMAVTGARQVYAKPGWGGGPDAPQNTNIHPAPAEFRIAFAVFRTKDSNSSVRAESRVAHLSDKLTGAGLSVKSYYEEVSHNKTPSSTNPKDPVGTTVKLLGGQVFGPIDLDYSWGDLFEPDDKNNPWSPWSPKGGTWNILGGAFSAHLLDRGLADTVTRLANSVVLSVLPGTDGPYQVGEDKWPAQWSWAFAADAQHYWMEASAPKFTQIPAVVMPAALPSDHATPWTDKEWVSTICHELAHTLGCPDIYKNPTYPAEILDRMLGSWDLMGSDAPLPHFSLAHRMRLGWINPDWIEVCDFGKNPASRTVTLQATETLARTGPPVGRRAGIEVRIRDGWNYYFELRRAQATQIGDRQLPSSGAVLGTDVAQAGADEMARPLILKLPLDVDGDGPVLRSVGADYEESDVTNPDRMNDFRITRQFSLPADPNSVKVEVQYLGAHRAELQITPAPGRDNFKSPDIDVDGPAGANVVVKGRLNTIAIRVHNKGSKAADAVRIKVGWLPFTTAPGKWSELATPPTQPIPAHATRTFSVPWETPASVMVDGKESEHFCIRVDVDRYVDPADPAGSEIVVHNNWAQSNFSTAAVGHGSPSERRDTVVRATNALTVGALHHTLVEQSSEHFRAYLDHAWKWLAPGETDFTALSFESLAGDPVYDENFQRDFREYGGERMTNDLRARTFILPDRERDGSVQRSGVQLHIRVGVRTFIDALEALGELVRGKVWAGERPNIAPADGGTVRLIAWPMRRPKLQVTRDASVGADGSFKVLVPGEVLRFAHDERILVEVFYLGTARYVPCRSRTTTLRSG